MVKTPSSVKVRVNCGFTAIAREFPRQRSGAWLAVENLSSAFPVHKNVTSPSSANFNLKSSLRAALDAVRDSDNSSAIASLMEEVQHLRDKETKNAEPWSKVVRKGKRKGKGNGTGKGSSALSEPK